MADKTKEQIAKEKTERISGLKTLKLRAERRKEAAEAEIKELTEALQKEEKGG